MAIHDGDILYLYDAKLANPNGDPDDENRPRMDEATGRNLVSDVRLKRYLRDHWLNAGEDIWVRRTEQDETTSSKQRMGVLLADYNRENSGNLTERQARQSREFKQWLLRRLRDVRLFGATMPMEQNTSITFTGPVQFGWGYSLHRVEINNSATISSHFAGRENEYGTFGKDWRVHYSLLAFHGIVSRNRARHTGLQEDDLTALDEA
ncbi:MAG: type I-B CRISPR-associated protein Cas7/Csh2, partial [Actinomycetota bacterium]